MPVHEPATLGRRMRGAPAQLRSVRWPCRVAAVVGSRAVTVSGAEKLPRHGIEWVEYPDVFSALIGAGASSPEVLILPTDACGDDYLSVVSAVTARLPALVLAGISLDTESQELGFHALERGARGLIPLPLDAEGLVSAVSQLGLPAPGMAAELTCGPIVLDSAAMRVTVNGQTVHLTPKEFDVLRYLMTQSPRAVPITELAEHCDREGAAGLHRVRVAVLRARRKLEQAYGCRILIETVRGLGYRMATD